MVHSYYERVLPQDMSLEVQDFGGLIGGTGYS